ncbi:PTS system enzyme IIA component [Spiroplasma clarkii]|uniref:Ascorbate-specific PTS system EIIA component n=1 Tax=Spiroplasma clarkii TaxID=2139 RepID=A0A1Y0L053_9MOLU|nr:PTS sugar transporter subunit IIA [Spiroplasma clarkii]ARU91353.1 PTS system enzyme IIA component [Spiroplasma clarkii]ATX70774.1 PTS system, ascorbate-specific IIA component [Spiroplasma clarkii]
MNKLVDKQLFTFVSEKLGWEEAIGKGVELLVKNNVCTQELLKQIVESTKKFGPYYVLSDKIALAHAAPGKFCLKPQLALVYLKEETFLLDSDKHPVKAMFVLSAPDTDSHLSILKSFATAFSDKIIREKFINLESAEEVLKLMFSE